MKRRINHGQATLSTLMCARVIHFIVLLNSRCVRGAYCEGRLRTSDGLIDHHPRHWFFVLFLLWRVNAMGLRIDGKAMDCMLDAKVFQLTVVVWIVLMKNRNSTAVTRYIDPAQTRIEFD